MTDDLAELASYMPTSYELVGLISYTSRLEIYVNELAPVRDPPSHNKKIQLLCGYLDFM